MNRIITKALALVGFALLSGLVLMACATSAARPVKRPPACW